VVPIRLDLEPIRWDSVFGIARSGVDNLPNRHRPIRNDLRAIRNRFEHQRNGFALMPNRCKVERCAFESVSNCFGSDLIAFGVGLTGNRLDRGFGALIVLTVPISLELRHRAHAP
jgi:hypothetical protein